MARVRLTFCCLVDVWSGAARLQTRIPLIVDSDIREGLADPVARRGLCDLVGLPWCSADREILDGVTRALELGRVHFELPSFVSTTVAPSAVEDVQSLAELAEPEEEVRQRFRIVIELHDEDGAPVPGIEFVVIDGARCRHTGCLDDEGRAELTGLDSDGACRVFFPELDGDAWDYVHASPL